MQRSSDCNDNQPPGIPRQANAQAWRRASSGKTAKCERRQGRRQVLLVVALPIVPPIDYSVPMYEDQSCPLPATEIDSRTSRGNDWCAAKAPASLVAADEISLVLCDINVYT
jgi:hypothetical protein